MFSAIRNQEPRNMPASIIDSSIFGNIFGTAAMRQVWSDENRTAKYLEIEAALAKVQGRLGIIPQQAADEIVRNCRIENIDMEKLRQQIDQLDDELLQVVGQRMKISEKIGQYKKDNNITILQTNRWNDILERAFLKGDKLDLSKEFITKYFDAMHMESINHQNRVLNS